MSDPSSNEVAVFNAARRLAGEERAAYLDQACAGDAAMRRRLEELLRVDEGAGDFLEKPVQPDATSLVSLAESVQASLPPTEKPGDRIGPYKLLQQIGEGGCGVVYMAEQEQPIRRRVALKIIKLGMDTKHVIARFEAERQALALMDHQNIAKVLDAGATPTGRPYFVMELVRGLKITAYCDQQKFSTQQRLDLFIQVCQAVQHAHQKGIIHRDLKPSNILVTEQDGAAVPKIIDFGIAKATSGERLTDKTIFTAFEQFIGTPAYMSPEQAGLGGLDIDTRSDIYSLGVLLYELLTGHPPFDAEQLRRSALDEILRTIREKEPPRPSTKLSALTDLERTTVAGQRQTEAAKLRGLLSGDLDWIVMKCLEKDRGRRYETANGLAADIRRHLNTEPVIACPPSWLYELGKTIRRHRVGFLVTAAIIASLAGGIVVSTIEASRAHRAEMEQLHLRQQAEAGEQKAKTEAAKSQKVSQFLQDIFNGIDPDVALGLDTKLLRQLVDGNAARVEQELTNQPEVAGELLITLGAAYCSIGQHKTAVEKTRQALEIYRRTQGPNGPGFAKALVSLSRCLWKEGNLAESETTAREGLAIFTRLDGPESLNVANALHNLGTTLWARGKLAEAETCHRRALDICRKLKDEKAMAKSLDSLALVINDEGRLREAEATNQESVTLLRKLHDEPDLAHALINRAVILGQLGRFDEAEAAAREDLIFYTKVAGETNVSYGLPMCSLAGIIFEAGRPDEAEAMCRKALSLKHILQGDEIVQTGENPLWQRWYMLLSGICSSKGSSAEAESVARQAVESARTLPATDVPNAVLFHSLDQLAMVLNDKQDKFKEAESVQREALKIARTLDDERNSEAITMCNLAMPLGNMGRFDEAEAVCREALEIQSQPGKPAYAKVFPLMSLAIVLRHKGNAGLQEAESAVRKALDLGRTEFALNGSSDAKGVIQTALNLEKRLCYQEQKFAEAESFLREQRAFDREASHSAAENGNVTAQNDAAWSLATSPESNLRDGKTAVRFAEKAVAATHRKNSPFLDTLAAAYAEAGQFSNAISVEDEAIALETNRDLKTDYSTRKSLYQSNKPYREVDFEAFNLHVQVLEHESRWAEEETAYRNLLDVLRIQAPSDDSGLVDAIAQLDVVMLREDKTNEAERLLKDYLVPPMVAQTQSVSHVISVRADFLASHGRWQEAASDFANVVELEPTNYYNYHLLAPLLVAGGDVEKYRKLCQEIVARFGDTTDPFVGERMAKACLILPDSGADLTAVAGLADTAITRGAGESADFVSWFSNAKDLAEYRQGHYKAAVKWTQKALANSDPERDVEAGSVLAMAQYRLMQTKEARLTLAKAVEIANKRLPKLESGDIGNDWLDWIIAHKLLDEATALIEGGSKTNSVFK